MSTIEPSHFVCVVIYRTNPSDGQIEFLVIDYRSTNPKTGKVSELQTKFCGGMNRYADEPVIMTGRREILEELSLATLPVDFKEIWRLEIREHTKYGFLLSFEKCRGELRTEVLKDNNDTLGVPYWWPAVTLGRGLFHCHQAPYLAACRELGIEF